MARVFYVVKKDKYLRALSNYEKQLDNIISLYTGGLLTKLECGTKITDLTTSYQKEVKNYMIFVKG